MALPGGPARLAAAQAGHPERIDTMLIYQDNLITISDAEIIFAHYYYPTGREKVVRLADIEWIKVKRATILNGKWRILGTGNFKTWFPRDIKRPRRDRIFFFFFRSRWIDIGFTVEDADLVEKIFRDNGLIKAE